MTEAQTERIIQLLGIIARGANPDWGNIIKEIVDNHE
jgi:hypothetical protein